MPGSDIRLAALGLWHEANTFSPLLVDGQTMAEAVLVGDEIVERYRSGTSTMSGFLDARSDQVDVVPLVMTSLVPRGRITADALRVRVDDIVDRLSSAGPFDGVLAALHGAAVAEGCDDVDGYVLRRIREVVGPDVPIGVALDLHANISGEMCAQADAINTYRTNPHLDAHVTAREIADIVVAAARGEVAPTVSFVPIPAVINILRQNTEHSPMREIIAATRAAMDEPGILSATVAEGFPYADVAEMGMSVVVVADGDTTLGHEVATRLATTVWGHRDEFEGDAPN